MSGSHKLSYGDILRELRIYHDYKQKDLSHHLNITPQTYSNYERGKRVPDLDLMYKIAHFYNLTLDQLVTLRRTRMLEESGTYMGQGTVYRGVTDSGLTISLTAKQAKMVTDILELPEEQQDACYKFVEFMKQPHS